MLEKEFVVVVNDQDEELEIVPKSEIHSQNTPLHRAFSLYIFDPQGRVLTQQRNKQKLTWPGFWSNSCCGHPAPGETRKNAARRRSKEELGVDVEEIERMADYRYRFEQDGIVENEICPIYAGLIHTDQVTPDPSEIEEIQWMNWSDFLDDLQHGEEWSPWAKEQALILAKSPVFLEWIRKHGIDLK